MFTSNHSLQRTQVPEVYQEIEIDANLLQHSPCSQEETCTDCVEHYRAYDQQFTQVRLYSRNIPHHEAAEIVKSLALSATDNREALKKRLLMHGDIFMSRWKKRSRDKRAELLSNANAHLPDRRCQDLFALTQSNKGAYDWKLSRTPRMRFRLLLPYLAMESLKENPGLLFALMHYRTEYSLDDWATFDLHQCHNAWESGLFDVNFSSGCIVAHGPRYGTLVPFDEKLIHRGDIIGFPRAQLLLEAQSELIGFLVRVVDATLEGANLDSPSCSKWSAACKEGFRASGEIVQWSNYSNAPFSAPPHLDIETCITTAQLRFNAVADHLHLLQTDPAYARRYIRLVQQGQAYRSLGKDSYHLVDAHISADVMNLYWWLCIKEEAEHVKQVRARFEDQIHRGFPLPPKYDNALAAFELVLVNLMNIRCMLVRNEAQQRPGFEKYWESTRESEDILTMRQRHPGIPDKFFSDPLYWCMMNLTVTADQEGAFEHAHVFAFLDDHLASASGEERARLDQIVLDGLSDIAANHQMLLAVRLSRPQNKAGDRFVMLKTEDRRAWKEELYNNGVLASSPTRGMLLKRFYETPAPHGRRDQAWLDQFDLVNYNLGDYWKALRPAAEYHMRDDDLVKLLQADLDPAHQTEIASYRQAVLNEITARQILPEQPLEIKQLHLSDSPAAPVTKKKKKKTRPAQVPAEIKPPPSGAEPIVPTRRNSSSSTSSIATTKRAVGIFTKMFSKNTDVAGQGCDWDQFVLSMQDVGFTACSSTGSAVQFDLGDKGKIVFHKPHPVPKVDSILLKAMGKRLQKWFGFGKDSFVEKA